jgi:membrane protein
MKQLSPVKEFVQEVYQVWVSEKPNQLAAALAYFGIFSFAAVIYLAFRIAGIFIDEAAAAERFYSRIAATLGADIASYIQDSVNAVNSANTGGSVLVTVISLASLLFAAMGLLLQLKYVLNRIWHVPLIQSKQRWALIRRYAIAYIMVVALGLLIILISMANVIFIWFGSIIKQFIDVGYLLVILDMLTILGIFAVAHAFYYKILPDIKIAWKDVWIGSIVATLIMALGVAVIALYFKVGGVHSAFEAAGAFAVVIIAIYYFSQIFLLGAIITRVYARKFGSMRSLP